MKKKKLNRKLNLSKKTISNLDKSGLKGGTLFGDSQGSPCIATFTNCDDCDDTGGATTGCPPTTIGIQCLTFHVSCNNVTCYTCQCNM